MKSYAIFQDKGDIFSHMVQLYSSERTPMDDTRIPYGHKESVEGTPYDFRESKVLTEGFLNSVGNDVMKVCPCHFLLSLSPWDKIIKRLRCIQLWFIYYN